MIVYYREGFIRYGGVFGGIDCTESERVKVDFGAKVDKAKGVEDCATHATTKGCIGEEWNRGGV